MKSRNGFTLIELMVTVVILAILSVVAGVGYQKYIRKARTTEAISFLADVKMKQETYYQTYGQYVDTGNSESSHDDSDFYPPEVDDELHKWEITCPQDAGSYPGWCALGCRPTDGETRFQYVTVGWQPEDPPPSEVYVKDPDRRWWYAVAHGDLDGNQKKSTFILTSEVTEVYFFNENE